MSKRNMQVLLARRPVGWVEEQDFRIVEAPIPLIETGQVLVKNRYLSLDPYMRGRMDDKRSYSAPVQIGAVMVGETVGEVVDSQNPTFRIGDAVAGFGGGWQQYALSDGCNLRKIDGGAVPLSAHLGAVGMPGVTAWIGLFDIGEPEPGETVVVSAASGAVGSVVGQLAKLGGCRVVGIAGGTAKCNYVVNELGFDACVDYRVDAFSTRLAAAVPSGIDIYFENVGGAVFDAVVPHCNPFARIPLCGMISDYNSTEHYGIRNLGVAVNKRIKIQGFIISDHFDRWSEALTDLARLVQGGQIKYRETVTQGLENAPKAFVGLFKGENLGKQLVKLA